MATENNHDHEEQTPLNKLGYATDEPSPRFVATLAASIVGFVIFCSVVAAIFLAIPGIIPQLSHPTTPFQRQHPPTGQPILQNNVTVTTDIRDLRQREDALLRTYGKSILSTPVGATYRIPIDKAIDLVAAEHNLDSTQAWLQKSSHPVPGDLSATPAGPKADITSLQHPGQQTKPAPTADQKANKPALPASITVQSKNKGGRH